MVDSLGRTVNYLRLSITDRCNLRCQYCMPEAGLPLKQCSDLLRYEELLRIATAAAALGVEKVRVTGGEPLVRKGCVDFISRLKMIPGISEVALTTNGTLLADYAADLKQAGIDLLNVSIDSLNPETFAGITRGGEMNQVLAGLHKAVDNNLRIKLNMVVMRGVNDAEVEQFAALSLTTPWSVRFIEYMPTIRESNWRERIVSGAEILARLKRRFSIEPLQTERLCGPARPFRIKGAMGTIGIITPMSEHFCGSCNRIRVTSTGLAKSCLLADQSLDLKPALARGDLAIRAALLDVIASKGSQHHFLDEEQSLQMSGIGG